MTFLLVEKSPESAGFVGEDKIGSYFAACLGRVLATNTQGGELQDFFGYMGTSHTDVIGGIYVLRVRPQACEYLLQQLQKLERSDPPQTSEWHPEWFIQACLKELDAALPLAIGASTTLNVVFD